MSELLCGHWTFVWRGGRDLAARCDLPAGHDGMHKFWTNPARGESFSWADAYERHTPRIPDPQEA